MMAMTTSSSMSVKPDRREDIRHPKEERKGRVNPDPIDNRSRQTRLRRAARRVGAQNVN